MIPITGLNHAVLFVRNLERSLDFYKTVFGLLSSNSKLKTPFGLSSRSKAKLKTFPQRHLWHWA